MVTCIPLICAQESDTEFRTRHNELPARLVLAPPTATCLHCVAQALFVLAQGRHFTRVMRVNVLEFCSIFHIRGLASPQRDVNAVIYCILRFVFPFAASDRIRSRQTSVLKMIDLLKKLQTIGSEIA